MVSWKEHSLPNSWGEPSSHCHWGSSSPCNLARHAEALPGRKCHTSLQVATESFFFFLFPFTGCQPLSQLPRTALTAAQWCRKPQTRQPDSRHHPGTSLLPTASACYLTAFGSPCNFSEISTVAIQFFCIIKQISFLTVKTEVKYKTTVTQLAWGPSS